MLWCVYNPRKSAQKNSSVANVIFRHDSPRPDNKSAESWRGQRRCPNSPKLSNVPFSNGYYHHCGAHYVFEWAIRVSWSCTLACLFVPHSGILFSLKFFIEITSLKELLGWTGGRVGFSDNWRSIKICFVSKEFIFSLKPFWKFKNLTWLKLLSSQATNLELESFSQN